MNPPEVPDREAPDELSRLKKSKKIWGWAIWICAIAVALPPLFGLAGTIIGMLGAFNELGQAGTADPEALSKDISFALLTTMYGLVISLLALIGLLVSITIFLNKRKALLYLERAAPPTMHQAE